MREEAKGPFRRAFQAEKTNAKSPMLEKARGQQNWRGARRDFRGYQGQNEWRQEERSYSLGATERPLPFTQRKGHEKVVK